ncbi:unnamed protein product [Urochloa humidicola]
MDGKAEERSGNIGCISIGATSDRDPTKEKIPVAWTNEVQELMVLISLLEDEKDVLLVGDDPWEDFVNCVRCIRILSPQEEMQMRLASDFGDSFLPNQACSSSDGGHPWRVTGD